MNEAVRKSSSFATTWNTSRRWRIKKEGKRIGSSTEEIENFTGGGAQTDDSVSCCVHFQWTMSRGKTASSKENIRLKVVESAEAQESTTAPKLNKHLH